MSEKPKQTAEEFLREKGSLILTDSELAMHQRVYELAAATGADPIMCMTAGSQAVLGQRIYGGRESIMRQIKACVDSMIKEAQRVQAASLICPPSEESSKIILTGPSGIVKH